MASATPLVAMGSFSYRYPGAAADALREIDLEIAAGELVVLAGRSGSGKSSLLRACCGLVPHYHGGDVAGSLSVCGLDVRDHGPADLGGLVGFVGQDPETQVVSATVRGELELPLELRGEPAAARARAIEEASLTLAIAHLAERATDTLSGGELQRVALAAALVLRPRLVLLDEPTSQLDPVAGDELVGLLRRLNEEWGMGVVLAEHRLERCLSAADRVLAIDAGRIAFDGPPADFGDWALDCRSGARDPGGAAVLARRHPAAPGRGQGCSPDLGRPRDRARQPRPRTTCVGSRGKRGAAARRASRQRRVARARLGRGRAGRGQGGRALDRCGRAGRADGPKRSRQEHAAARRGRAAVAGPRHDRGAGRLRAPSAEPGGPAAARAGRRRARGPCGRPGTGVGGTRVGGRARPP